MGIKVEGIPRVCHRELKKLLHPWDTHYQFSIKTLLSNCHLSRASVCVPTVIGVLAVWRQSKPKTMPPAPFTRSLSRPGSGVKRLQNQCLVHGSPLRDLGP